MMYINLLMMFIMYRKLDTGKSLISHSICVRKDRVVMSNIQDKVVIITGASSGIGEATAKELASRGAKLVLAARREDRLKKLQEEIKNSGGQAIYKVTDVTSYEQMEELAAYALKEFGKIDVLINNAGIMPHSFLYKKKVDDWNRMIDVNIKGVLYGIAAVLPSMRERKEGHIINVSSVAGHVVGLEVLSMPQRSLLCAQFLKVYVKKSSATTYVQRSSRRGRLLRN